MAVTFVGTEHLGDMRNMTRTLKLEDQFRTATAGDPASHDHASRGGSGPKQGQRPPRQGQGRPRGSGQQGQGFQGGRPGGSSGGGGNGPTGAGRRRRSGGNSH